MVKAKDFWNYLCDGLDYRFFSGVACPGLSELYKAMSRDFMHYVPATDERIALGLSTGAYLSGLKGGILMDMRFGYDLNSSFTLNIDHKIPLLIIGYGDKESYLPYDFPRAVITTDNFKPKLNFVVKNMEKENVPGLLVISGGVL
jgi:hypothetical protein